MVLRKDAKRLQRNVNTLLGLVPPLNPSDTVDILTGQLLEAADLIVPDDPLSPFGNESNYSVAVW